METEWVVVFESVRPEPCRERSLVLQSQGVPFEMSTFEGLHRLFVPASFAVAARDEIEAYADENRHWQPRRQPLKLDLLNPRPGLFLYVLMLLFVGWAAGVGLIASNWFEVGRVNAGRVAAGELWRVFTALTLHADLGHLVSNIGFGLLFGYFAGQFFGSGVGWLAIVLSGGLGNGLNSVLNAPTHNSVGASTAIFGALGLIAAYSWRRKWFPQDRWISRLGPLAGGVALLAFTGTGGERTDVGAHVTGFVCGVMLGAVLAAMPTDWLKSPVTQWLCGVTAMGLMLMAWAIALFH